MSTALESPRTYEDSTVTLTNRKLKRALWIYCFIVFTVKPLAAQPIPANFHEWFLQQVAGKPFGQQTLLELAPQLPCVGSALTPPNAAGERTKIWDPDSQTWTRVGFGEGVWVWIHQSPAAPPTLLPADFAACGSKPLPNPQTPVETSPQFDLSVLYARLDSIIAAQRCGAKPEEQGPLCQQAERMFAFANTQRENQTKALLAEIDAPAWYTRLMKFLATNPAALAVEGALGTCVATQCWKPRQ